MQQLKPADRHDLAPGSTSVCRAVVRLPEVVLMHHTVVQQSCQYAVLYWYWYWYWSGIILVSSAGNED
jgi:hypothetical protein